MEDHSFTFIVESVHLFLSTSRSKHLWTVHWFLHTCILHLLYYSMLTISMRYACYKLKATAETSSSFVLLQCLYFELLLYELTLMQDLLMLVLKVLFMKSLCFMIHLFTHVIYIVLIAAFTTYALRIVWSRLWWHVTPEIICVIVLPARDEQN